MTAPIESRFVSRETIVAACTAKFGDLSTARVSPRHMRRFLARFLRRFDGKRAACVGRFRVEWHRRKRRVIVKLSSYEKERADVARLDEGSK